MSAELKSKINVMEELRKSGFLIIQKIGMRNIIDAATGTVTCLGLDISEPGKPVHVPMNIMTESWQRRAYVEYMGGRSRLIATPGHYIYFGCSDDVSGIYPENETAEEMFMGPGVRGDNYERYMDGIFGDAVLITDIKRMWWLNTTQTKKIKCFDEIRDCLSTKNRVALHSGSTPAILFEETPIEDELVSLRLLLS